MLLYIFKKKSYEAYPYLLVVKGGQINATKVRQVVMENTDNFNLRMRNSNNQTGSEIIYEIKFGDGNEDDQEDEMIKRISQLENVNVVNIVYYRGEIPG